MKRSFYFSLLVAFMLLSALVYLLHGQNEQFALWPLLLGNFFFAGIFLLSFYITNRGIHQSNGYAMIRAKMVSMLLKLFLCLGVLLGFIFWSGIGNIYKPAIFLLVGMYVVYAALEAIPLAKIAKIDSADRKEKTGGDGTATN